MQNYLYVDNDSGEEFYVQSDNRKEADEKAVEVFGPNIEFLAVHDDETAERYGYDTY